MGNNDTMDDWWVVASGGCILKIGLRHRLMVKYFDHNKRPNVKIQNSSIANSPLEEDIFRLVSFLDI